MNVKNLCINLIIFFNNFFNNNAQLLFYPSYEFLTTIILKFYNRKETML